MERIHTEEHQSAKRDSTFDIAKGIGILCVILGHMGGRVVFRVVYSFHMPLFFLISGWFLNRALPVKDFAVKELKRLLPVYLSVTVFRVVKLIIDCIRMGITNLIPIVIRDRIAADLYGIALGSDKTLLNVPVGSVGLMWFLPALFWGTLITRLILQIPKLRAQIVTAVLVFVVSMKSVQWVWLPFDIQTGGCAALFVYTGWLTRNHIMGWLKNRAGSRSSETEKWILLPALTAWLIELVTGIVPDMCQNLFPCTAVCCICSVMICYGVLYVSKLLTKYKRAQFLSVCGRYSLLILLMHLIETECIQWDSVTALCQQFGAGMLVQRGIIALCRYAVIFMLSAVFSRVHFMRRLLGYDKQNHIQ